MPQKTLVVMEHNWGVGFGEECSVFPFINGANEHYPEQEQQNVSYQKYRTTDDFRNTLEVATADKDQVYIIYIAAHGNNKSIGSSHLSSILAAIAVRAESRNIEGILAGSCLTGNSMETYKTFMLGNSLKWAVAYTSKVFWLDGTILDTKILNEFLHDEIAPVDEIEHYVNKNLSFALTFFNHQYNIGTIKKKGEDHYRNIEESLMLVFHESGRGRLPRSVEASVFFEEQKMV